MKNVVGILVLLFACSTAVHGVEWENWEVVDDVSGNLSQAAMDVRQGLVAITYLKAPVIGNDSSLLYSEYVYSSQFGKTQTIQDEPVPSAVSTWGTNICGIALDNWNRPYIAVIPELDGTLARTLKRQDQETYVLDDAHVYGSTAPYASLGSTHESFELDSDDNLHFVWATSTAGPQQIVYATKPDWKMNPSESTGWVSSVMSTSGALSYVRPALTTDSSGDAHISYLDDNSGGSVFYTSDMTTSYIAGYSGVGTPGTRHDIEISSTGRAHIAHVDLSTGGGIVVDVDYYGDGTYWRRTVAIADIDPRNYGWFGVAPCLDLEPTDNGNMALIVAHLDDYDLGSSARTIVEYHSYVLGRWSHFTIGTFDTGTSFVSALDLEFDENGKPFILVVTKQNPTSDSNAFILTTAFPGAGYCGDHYTPYLSGDYNEDCVVDSSDLLSMTQDWLECTDPENADCDEMGVSPKVTDGFPPYMQVDGEPFFPIGWYCGRESIGDPDTQEVMNQNATDFLNEVAATGANFVMPYGLHRAYSNYMTAYLEGGLVADVKIMIDIDPPADVQVNFCQPYDSLFGWYTADEPEAFDTSPSYLQDIYNDIRTYDTGNHPVCVTHHGHWYGATPYLWPTRHCDIMSVDRYPVYGAEYSGLFWEVAQNAKYYSKIAQQQKLGPYMPVPQAFGGMGGWRLSTLGINGGVKVSQVAEQ